MRQPGKINKTGYEPDPLPPDAGNRPKVETSAPHGSVFVLVGLGFMFFLAILVIFVMPELGARKETDRTGMAVSRSQQEKKTAAVEEEQAEPEPQQEIINAPVLQKISSGREQKKEDLRKQACQQAIGQAITALAEKKFTRARAALDQAKTIRPNDRIIVDLAEQIDDREQTHRLLSLEEQSVKSAEQEKWQQALDTCSQALVLSPTAAFALSCRDNARSRLELDTRLEAILSQPEKLFAPGPLRAAKEVQRYALTIAAPGPRLTGQLSRLAPLVTLAETETEIMLHSDGLTDIVIYHVGRLGRFNLKKLMLRSGNYTAVGSRAGFRDVRRLLKVRADGKNDFTVRCEERI